MAVDSTLFAGKIPAATYAVGDVIELSVIRGPKVVRDGYGAAKLKRFFAVSTAQSTSWAIHAKNSNWIDDMSNIAVTTSETLLGYESSAIQNGNDCDLVPNSGWQMYAVCISAGTEANDTDLMAMLDIDYPSVAAVANPRQQKGYPVTIDESIAITKTARGSAITPIWTTVNRDVLKAGYRYLLTEAAFKSASLIGFLSISGAAGQAGLERIIPVKPTIQGLKYPIDYSTPLVKGPMNVNIMTIDTAQASETAYVYFDFVKRNI